jgi:hypothetical protein
MDWTTFIKDNSQALFTLVGVFLGSAITFLGNYLSNRFQAKENDKEREEKRRDAKHQLAIELMKNDIKHIEDVNNLTFEFINNVKILNLKRDSGELTSKEWFAELKLMMTSEKGIGAKLVESDTTTEVMVYLFGNEIYSKYCNYKDIFEKYLNMLSDPSATDENLEHVSEELVVAMGTIQQLLRKKLISARDKEPENSYQD